MKHRFFPALALACALALAPAASRAQYRNPIINADVPDMSVCRQGKYFYMVSTTMHLMPGCPVMRSRDMQHWETVSYVFDRIDDGPRYDLLDHESAYGQGQWASSIRYHNGQFYVWFTANGAPGRGFVYTAKRAEGPWTLVARPPHLHDGSLFFDDDGRVYIFNATGHLTEMEPDLSDIKKGGVDMQLFERDPDEQGLLEGSSVVKHDGRYYLLMISMDWSIPGRLRREVCYRADRITGPYEKKVILETPFESYGGVGQGCIVDGPKGEWYGLIFQDRGGVGRVPCLMPCRWTDGWPMLGDADGHIPSDTALPYTDLKGIMGSDEFSDSRRLKLYWQWNHNPVDSAWSLKQRKGYLRLTTARTAENLYLAPNTLTQRLCGPACTATVALDYSGMNDGDRCGIAAFNGDSGVLQVVREGGSYRLVMTQENSRFRPGTRHIDGADIEEKGSVRLDGTARRIYLRLHADFRPGRDMATFAYSLDGKTFTPIGAEHKMRFDHTRMFMGSKLALFNYATRQTGGHADFDWCHFEQERR